MAVCGLCGSIDVGMLSAIKNILAEASSVSPASSEQF